MNAIIVTEGTVEEIAALAAELQERRDAKRIGESPTKLGSEDSLVLNVG